MQFSTQSRIILFPISLLLAVALCSLPVQAADGSDYTVEASANEVRIAFAASDRQGHVIKSLRSSDVAVADNGSIIRYFRSFRPATQTPLDLVLLLDASGSVKSQLPEEIAEVKFFVENSAWEERDRVSILAFGGMQPQLLCARNCGGAQTQMKLAALRADGATPLYDALLEASEILTEDRDPESRPAMILFSDGMDTTSMNSMGAAVQAAEKLQASIYAVNSRLGKSAPESGDAVLDFLAASTGGLSFGPGQNVKQVLQTVIDDLHSGYVLTYELPEKMSGEHSVRILPTSDARLQFRSRQAYSDPANE
jgi:VWFA-related protein